MNKITTYTIMFSGIMILFYFGGLVGSENSLMTFLLNPQNLSAATFFKIALAGIGTAVAAITIGYYTKNAELALMTVFVPIYAAILFDFMHVYNVIASENTVIAKLLFAPIILLLGYSIVEFWRGRD